MMIRLKLTLKTATLLLFVINFISENTTYARNSASFIAGQSSCSGCHGTATTLGLTAAQGFEVIDQTTGLTVTPDADGIREFEAGRAYTLRIKLSGGARTAYRLNTDLGRITAGGSIGSGGVVSGNVGTAMTYNVTWVAPQSDVLVMQVLRMETDGDNNDESNGDDKFTNYENHAFRLKGSVAIFPSPSPSSSPGTGTGGTSGGGDSDDGSALNSEFDSAGGCGLMKGTRASSDGRLIILLIVSLLIGLLLTRRKYFVC